MEREVFGEDVQRKKMNFSGNCPIGEKTWGEN